MRELDIDVFFIDEDRLTLEWIYYNPDSESEGQFVENRIEIYDVIRAFYETETPEEFFGRLLIDARCFLFDKGEECFEEGAELYNTEEAFLKKMYVDIRHSKEDVRCIFLKCLCATLKYYSED